MSLRYLTAGESHGQALVGIIEGIPSGLELDGAYLHAQAKRRKLGYGRGNRQNIETDEIRILSGVRFGRTLGSPIALIIENRDWRSWSEIMSVDVPADESRRDRRAVSVPRPGHADRIGGIKYAHVDMRNVLERASARETAMRVALGSVARKLLEAFGVRIQSRVIRIGEVVDDVPFDDVAPEQIDASPVRALGEAAAERMIRAIEEAKTAGDTLGGVVEIVARDVPVGLGSYAQWDRRLEAEVGKALLSLNAIKGVEVGLGFELAALPGSSAHDSFYPADGDGSINAKTKYRTNRSGGIDGGMTTGQPIVVRAAMKPLATLMKPLDSVDLRTGEATRAHVERSDVCAVPSAAVIGESLLALVLAAALLEKFGGDEIEEIKARVHAWAETVRAR
jgi:chorismate synthase